MNSHGEPCGLKTMLYDTANIEYIIVHGNLQYLMLTNK